MNRAALCLVVCALLAAGESLPPHQGTVVISEDRSFANVWVISETLDGVQHTLDGNRDSPPTVQNRGRYQQVVYAPTKDVPTIKGDNAAGRSEWPAAIAAFTDATKSRESWYTRENAYIRLAECLIQAGKHDEVGAVLDQFAAQFPKSARQARAQFLRGDALAKKGDGAGAMRVFTELAGKAEWGADAITFGALGQSQVLAADKKPDEAAKALAVAFGRLHPERDAQLFAQVGIALAQQQQAAGQAPAAIATLRRLAFAVEDASGRARAHLLWSQVLMAGGDAAALFQAFDQAVMARLVRGADGAIAEQAGAQAMKVSQLIDKLPADQASNELKAEYRRYLQR